MSSRNSSHQHGMHRIERRRPSATQSKRNNKGNNRGRQDDRAAAIVAEIQSVPEYAVA